MNVINENEKLIMEELIKIGIISNLQKTGGWGATWHKSNFLNLLKVMNHFAK